MLVKYQTYNLECLMKNALLNMHLKGGPKKMSRFFGRLFRQTSNVDILETVCSNDLIERGANSPRSGSFAT